LFLINAAQILKNVSKYVGSYLYIATTLIDISTWVWFWGETLLPFGGTAIQRCKPHLTNNCYNAVDSA